MRLIKSGESLKQCKNRLCMSRAQAIRAGQPHHKLDKQIECIESLISSKPYISHDRPSPSKYASHAKSIGKILQGGKVSPR